MEWTKAPQDMTDWLTARMADFPVDYRPMFGCPTWFYQGNMFSELNSWFARGFEHMATLPPKDKKQKKKGDESRAGNFDERVGSAG